VKAAAVAVRWCRRIGGVFLLSAALSTHVAAAKAGGPIAFALAPGPGLIISTPVAGAFLARAGDAPERLYTGLSSYVVSDSSGTGRGWKVSFQLLGIACTFEHRPCPAHDDLPRPSAMSMLPPRVSCAPGTDCTGPASPPRVLVDSETVLQVRRQVVIAAAPGGAGMGTYLFEPTSFDGRDKDLALYIPDSARANTYVPSMLESVVSGP